jgi:uncharacterized protein YndB with AHSA1/START domain
MKTAKKTRITVETTVKAPVEKVWECWTEPKHIIQWNSADETWFTPWAENDLRVGGNFISRMEARDGSFGFDFEGNYSEVKKYKTIAYTMSDGREVKIDFYADGLNTRVTETFDAENENPAELQKDGWQSILDNFKNYVETLDQGERLHFEITIDCKPEKVYQLMLNEKTYQEWTSVFNPTSSFTGTWEKGTKIIFTGSDENGNEGGMFSRIKENIPNRYVSIEHLGMIQKGEEITSGPEAEAWAGSFENYSITEKNEKTLLLIDLETKQPIDEKFKIYFTDTWPKALIKLKEICEKN